MNRAALARKSEAAPAAEAKASSGGLRIGPANDFFEQEANRAAEQVLSGMAPKAAWLLSKVTAPSVQRECSCGGECDSCKKKNQQTLQRESNGGPSPAVAPKSVHNVLGGSGRPMDDETRTFMESRFGHDFRNVRIYNDDAAARSARSVAAHAYTVGDKIVFDGGRYQPQSPSGRRLLAHELAHVVQQHSVSPASAAQLPVGGTNSASEAAAERAANASLQNDPSSAAEVSATARSAQISRPTLQRIPSYSEIKESAYKALIDGARKGAQATISLLRKSVLLLPASMQSGANTLVDIVDVILGAQNAVALAVIGIIVGIGEGVVDMVKGLVGLILGTVKVLFDVISGIFTNFDAAKQDWDAIVAAMKGLPGAVKKMITDWLDRFEKASSERQSLMIGELTGQIIALIGTFEVSAGRAGTVAKAGAEVSDAAAAAAKAAELAKAAEAAEAAAKAAKATEAAEAAAKAAKATEAAEAAAKAAKARPPLKALPGGGQTTAPRATTATRAAQAARTGSGGGSVGNAGGRATALAQAVDPAAQEAPKIVLRSVPDPVGIPDPVPVPTPLPVAPPVPVVPVPVAPVPVAPVPGLTRAVAAGAAVGAAKAAQISKNAQPVPQPDPDKDKKKKKKSCQESEPVEPLPIVWPEELPHPHSDVELVRTKGDLREVLGTDRGENQAKFAKCISNWRKNPRGLDLEDACPGDKVGFFQPGLLPGENIDAHHIHPLYLGGGDDWQGNLGAVETMRHRAGHRNLDNQQLMFDTDPTWIRNQVCSPKLVQHPVDQEYRIINE